MRLFLFALGFLFACLFYGTVDLFHRANLKEVVMRILLAALLSLLLVACASVAPVKPLYSLAGTPAPDGGGQDVVNLWAQTNEFCTGLHKDAKRATYHYRARVTGKPELSGTIVEGCYLITPDQIVLMVFKDGDQAAVPLLNFTQPTAAHRAAPTKRDYMRGV